MGLFYFINKNTVRLPETSKLNAIIIRPKKKEIRLTSDEETVVIKGTLEQAHEILRIYQIAKNQ